MVDDRVLAGISETSLNKEEGRMVKDTDAGDGVSTKTPKAAGNTSTFRKLMHDND